MKYSDEQRIEKVIAIDERLISYIKEQEATESKLLTDYTVQWTVTTSLYNLYVFDYCQRRFCLPILVIVVSYRGKREQKEGAYGD